MSARLKSPNWCCSGEFGKDLIDKWTPEFQQRLLEADQNGYMRGAHDMAKFLGAAVEVDAEGRVITVTPPAALKDVGIGELDSTPLVEPKTPSFH